MNSGNATNAPTETVTQTASNTSNSASTMLLGHDGQWWDGAVILSLVLAILVAAAVAVATGGSVIAHRREAKDAERQLEQYKARAAAEMAASSATASGAQADAAASNAVAEGAKVDAAKANERAATADEKAEAERLARVELEAKIAPRRLSPEQQAEIAASLAPFKGKRVRVVTYALDVESFVLATQIEEAIHRAGIAVSDGRSSIMLFGGFAVGIHFSGDENLTTSLYNAFCLKTGLEGKVEPNSGSPEGLDATILVGPKPPETIK